MNTNKNIVNFKLIIIALIIIIIGIICLFFSVFGEWENSEIWQSILREIGGLLLVSSIASLVWELWIKRNFLDEILSKVNLKKDVTDTGIIKITDSFLKISNNEWKIYFETAKELDFFFCYARSWHRNRRDDFNNLKNRTNFKIRVVLPNPSHDDTILELSRKFNYTVDQLRELIKETVSYYEKMKNDYSMNIELRLINETPLFSIYRFDDLLIFAIFTHREEVSVPTFTCIRGGTLYQYFDNEFNNIITKYEDIFKNNNDESSIISEDHEL